MKKINLFITALLISSTMFGQIQLNQYSNIPNIEKLAVSKFVNTEHILFASSDTLYKSAYNVQNNTLDSFNGIFTNTVTDIKNEGPDFVVSTTTDFKVFNMLNSINASLVTNDLYNSLAFSNGDIIGVNTNGPNNVVNNIDKSNYQLWNPNTNGFSPLETSPLYKIQMLDNDGTNYYYVTKAGYFYSSGQTSMANVSSNPTVNNMFNTSVLVDFGKFTRNGDVFIYCTYENNTGFIYNETVGSLLYLFNNVNNKVKAITYNDFDSTIYYSKLADNKIYKVDIVSPYNPSNNTTPVYTILNNDTITDIEFDVAGNIWVSANNGVFTNIPVTGMVNHANNGNTTSVEDEKETLNNVNLYPNPTTQYINVQHVKTNSPYQIYNQLGKLVLEGKTNQRINIENLTNGIYFLSIDGYSVQKVIKQ